MPLSREEYARQIMEDEDGCITEDDAYRLAGEALARNVRYTSLSSVYNDNEEDEEDEEEWEDEEDE